MVCPSCGNSQSIALAAGREVRTTHDTSASPYHIELTAWLKQLNGAIAAAWPNRYVTYSKVAVLMLSWENTDMQDASLEISRLGYIFKDVYNYEVEQWSIPSLDADTAILAKVQDFLRVYGHQDNLLIIYYAGHARPGILSGAPPIWHPTKDPEAGEEIDISCIQPLLARARPTSPDVLLLYDSCNSLWARPSNTKTSRAVVENLFAGGFESQVPIAGPGSFSASLIDELGLAARSNKPLSVVELHRRLICKLQQSQPRVMVTPSHLFLSVDTRPILLSPMKLHRLIDTNDRTASLALQDANGVMANTVDHRSWPKVLLALRLVDNEDNMKALQRWLLDAPSGVIEFGGMSPSFSTLLLVQVPIPVWDTLEPSPAVSFVSFISGPPTSTLLPRSDGSDKTFLPGR